MTNPTARCARIDFDDEEMPALLTIVMTDDVLERVRRDFDLDASRRVDRLMEAHPTMAEAADMARCLGRVRGLDLAGHEFYGCISNIANSFWEDGLNEAPTAGLVANSAKADRLPCGHPIAGSLFDLNGGGRGLIAHPPVDMTPHDTLPATVWCTQGCGWIDADAEAYERLTAVWA